MKELSLVIPVMNEEDNIKPLLEAVRSALKDIDYEIVLVDDGSTDGTKKMIVDNADERTLLVELRKNYGQSTAMTAGIDHANAKYIAMIDGDLQNDPTDIPFMLDLAKREDVCIHVLRNSSPALLARFQRHDPSEIKLCSVVKAELFHGAQRSAQKEANRLLLQRFFATFESVPFDDESADHYGQIRTELERAGTIIGPNDLMIAAIARARGLILVTHNTDEFSRVSGLQLDDWELAV